MFVHVLFAYIADRRERERSGGFYANLGVVDWGLDWRRWHGRLRVECETLIRGVQVTYGGGEEFETTRWIPSRRPRSFKI